MEKFDCGVVIHAGLGALGALKQWQGRRMLIVTDSLDAANGLAARVGSAAGAEDWEIFDRVAPQPTAELVSAGVARLRELEPHVLVGLGDADVIDLAKAMASFAGDVALAAVPTVPGTGAEGTGAVTLRHGEQFRRLENARLRPDMAVLDGGLLEDLPPALGAEGGFEGICRAIEGFTAKGASCFDRALAKDSLTVLLGTLPRFSQVAEVRQRVLNAGAMSALAARATGGLCGAMVEALRRVFPVSRGRLAAILLPAVMEMNAYAAGDAYGVLARGTGLGGSGLVLRQRVLRLRRELGLPENLRQAGVDPGALWSRTGQIVETVMEDPQIRQNPMTVEDFMVRRLLEQVTGR